MEKIDCMRIDKGDTFELLISHRFVILLDEFHYFSCHLLYKQRVIFDLQIETGNRAHDLPTIDLSALISCRSA